MDKIGRGKYSDVFKCVNTDTEELCVLKILKPGPPFVIQFAKVKSKDKSKFFIRSGKEKALSTLKPSCTINVPTVTV